LQNDSDDNNSLRTQSIKSNQSDDIHFRTEGAHYTHPWRRSVIEYSIGRKVGRERETTTIVQ